VWSTGQDQVAVIKRQLLRMVHGLSIFLDVDDLEDIGALERYIDETMVMLIFLSRGYFQSRNCLREVRAAMERARPIILVLETDETKGGFALADAREECPEELRDFVFGASGDERAVIPWHRITIFQVYIYIDRYIDIDIDIYIHTYIRPAPSAMLSHGTG